MMMMMMMIMVILVVMRVVGEIRCSVEGIPGLAFQEDAMGKVLLYLCGIAFLIAFVLGLIQDFGWWVLIVPLLAIGGLIALSASVSAVTGRAERVALAQANSRRRIAELEAAAGIPVAAVGTCPACGAPLLAGAKFCSSCRASLVAAAPAPRICSHCQTRNLDDATYCGECGERLDECAASSSPASSSSSSSAVRSQRAGDPVSPPGTGGVTFSATSGTSTWRATTSAPRAPRAEPREARVPLSFLKRSLKEPAAWSFYSACTVDERKDIWTPAMQAEHDQWCKAHPESLWDPYLRLHNVVDILYHRNPDRMVSSRMHSFLQHNYHGR